MAKYVFPAIIEKADDGYNVSFPDIENCFTCGKTFAEAIEMAQDVLPLMLCQMEDDKTPIPEASVKGAWKRSPARQRPHRNRSYNRSGVF